MAAGMRMVSNRKVFEMAYVMLGGAIVLELMATTMLKYAFIWELLMRLGAVSALL